MVRIPSAIARLAPRTIFTCSVIGGGASAGTKKLMITAGTRKVATDGRNSAKNGLRVTQAGTYDQVACFARSDSRA